ncbi:MAG: glycosyl hydrolase family 65 protein [Victivallaceae bacterium]|nr:glycosyl hydrolase family 65 protein [Victivallaceae bacterium]
MKKLYDIKNEWEIVENLYQPEENLYFETIFTLGNGYMAARGMPDEGFTGDSIPGFYVAGVFDHYENSLYELVRLPNIFNCEIIIDGNEFSPDKGRINNYSRTLNMRTGVLTRSFEWEFAGKKTFMEISRLVSMDNIHLAAAKYRIIPVNYSGSIELITALDKNTGNIDWGPNGTFDISEARHYHLKVINEGFDNDIFHLSTKTGTSGMEITQAVSSMLYSGTDTFMPSANIDDDCRIGSVQSFTAKRGKEFIWEKKIAIFTSRDQAAGKDKALALELLNSSSGSRFDDLRRRHETAWVAKWEVADIEITGNIEDQVAIRFNIFHLIQSNAENDPMVSIGGRLLGSEVFNGGVFWDTEMFVLPFFLYTNPAAAKNLLLYRYNTLDKARERAVYHWLRGAMYPWTSVYDGREQCDFWEYANVEVHLNADIAYNIWYYFALSGDEEFFLTEGLEILIETARFWNSRFFYNRKTKRYELILIQGPDEYTGPINNDTYTLIMAKLNLEMAVEAIERCQERQSDKWNSLRQKLDFTNDEIKKWLETAAGIYDDYYDEEQKLFIQDEVFLRRVPIAPFSIKIPTKMLRFTMPSYDTLLRYQIVKQPSIILLMYLLPDRFSHEEKLANWNFYEPKTIHDSSLSYNTHSIIASELGFKAKAYDYFRETAYLDLNKARDTNLGLHSACIGGAWQAVVNGFAGMRLKNGKLDFAPSIPNAWKKFRFKINYRGKVFVVAIAPDIISILVENTDSINEITVYDKAVRLPRDQEVVLKCR